MKIKDKKLTRIWRSLDAEAFEAMLRDYRCRLGEGVRVVSGDGSGVSEQAEGCSSYVHGMSELWGLILIQRRWSLGPRRRRRWLSFEQTTTRASLHWLSRHECVAWVDRIRARTSPHAIVMDQFLFMLFWLQTHRPVFLLLYTAPRWWDYIESLGFILHVCPEIHVEGHVRQGGGLSMEDGHIEAVVEQDLTV